MSTNCVTRYISEFIGTCLLVLIGCGCAVLSGGDVGFLGIAFSFGLALAVLVFCFGPISGCHLNPAITLCMAFSKKLPFSDVLGYIIAQCLGAILGAFAIYVIATGKAGFDVSQGFALNGFAEHSPKGYDLLSCFLTEAILTAVLLFVALSTTHKEFPAQFTAPALGFTLLTIHLVSLPVTNASVNFARSLGTAVFHGGWALEQLWLFAAAQIVAVAIAIIVHHWTCCQKSCSKKG